MTSRAGLLAHWTISLTSVMLGLPTLAISEDGQFGTPKAAEGTRIFKATQRLFGSLHGDGALARSKNP
jgi:hypothetical protein